MLERCPWVSFSRKINICLPHASLRFRRYYVAFLRIWELRDNSPDHRRQGHPTSVSEIAALGRRLSLFEGMDCNRHWWAIVVSTALFIKTNLVPVGRQGSDGLTSENWDPQAPGSRCPISWCSSCLAASSADSLDPLPWY